MDSGDIAEFRGHRPHLPYTTFKPCSRTQPAISFIRSLSGVSSTGRMCDKPSRWYFDRAIALCPFFKTHPYRERPQATSGLKTA